MRYFSFSLFVFCFFPFYSVQLEKSIEKENFLLNSEKKINSEKIKDLKMPENQIPEGINQNWFSEVQKNIEKEEYNITYQDGIKILNGGSAYQAPNRAQGFRTYFTKEGITVVSRTEEEPTWELGLSLQTQTEDTRQKTIDQNQNTNIYVEENRIEMDRGWIKEWYVNKPEGLEQGFIIINPVRPYSNTPLQIDLKLSGNLRPVFSEDGKAVDFYKDGGFNVLHYGNLIVKDALGNEVEGKFEPISGGIRITINDEGAVYPIVIDPLLTTPAWTAEANQANASFGWSVSIAGDVNGDGYSDVIVGAPYYDNGDNNEGRAYVYYGSSSGLSSTPSWTGESNQGGANFGSSVSTAGDVQGDGYSDVIIGAINYSNGETYEGRAFVYYGSSTGLSQTPNWTAEPNESEALFGYSVSTAGDVQGDGYSDVIIGSWKYSNGEDFEGKAYVYYGYAAGLSLTPNWTGESNQVDARYGISVSTAGDVNGDGYSDVIVGAYQYDNGQADEGAAFVYYGSESGLSITPNWTGESNIGSTYFGWSVSTAGDVNGDGYSDVIIGVPYYSNGQGFEGAAYVYYGSPTGLSLTPNWIGESNRGETCYGRSVSTAGDVQGDGYSDVIIGAEFYSNGQVYEGRAYVYYGSPSGLSTTPDWTVESNQEQARFGCSVSEAGDVQGDGYSDVIVGAYQYDNGQTDEGAAFLFYGSSSGLSLTPDWTGESNQAGANYGISVSTAGDVNGDGYSDVVIGAYNYDNGQSDEGRAYVYYGSSSGLSSTPDWTGESNQEGARYGNSVSKAGDVNGDGFSDIIIGARYYNNGELWEGLVYVYYGSSSGLSSSPAWTAEGNQAWVWYGYSVSTAADVNGDGYSDIIVGSYYYSNGQTYEGKAFVYYGNEGRSLAVKPQQMRSNFSVPIFPPLFSDSSNSFGFKHFARSDFGRVLAKTQIEVKPFGTPFNYSSFIETNWTDLETNGLEIQKLISGLQPNTLYKWRARIKYHPKYGLPIHSRWIYQQANGLTEADLRTKLDPSGDQDGDGIPNDSDCRPLDSTLWASPSPVRNFKISKEVANNLTWDAPENPGCITPQYDVLRSTSPSDFSSATCIESNGTDLKATDTSIPANIYYYLIRVENSCGSNLGTNSQGNPRSGRSCP